MKHLPFYIFLTGLLTTSTLATNHHNNRNAPAPANPMITPPPSVRHRIAKRQDPVPATVEIDNINDIVTSTDGITDLPTDNRISIRSNEDGSIDLLMGPDLLEQLKQTMGSSCVEDGGEGCQSAVQTTLEGANFGVEARNILVTAGDVAAGAGAAVAAGAAALLVGFANILSQMWREKQDVPTRLQMPASDVAVMTGDSMSTATNIVIATPGGTPTTVVLPSIVDSAAGASATFNDAGDLVFEISDPVLQWLQTEAQNTADCAANPWRSKRQAQECGVAQGIHAMEAMGENGPLAGLLANPFQNVPAPTADDVRNAGIAIFNAARGMAALAGVNDDVLWDLAFFFIMVFSENPLQGAVTIASSELLNDEPTPTVSEPTSSSTTTTSGTPCPTNEDTPACRENDCLGDVSGAKLCTAENDLKDCPCLAVMKGHLHEVDFNLLSAQQDQVQELFDAKPMYPTPEPSSTPDPTSTTPPEPTWTESWARGTCGLNLIYDFNTMFTAGGKTKMEVTKVWDGSGRTISAEPAKNYDVIADNDEYYIESELPLPVKILVLKWGDEGQWKYRKNFEFWYNNTHWKLMNEWDQPYGRCDLDWSLNAAENNNRAFNGTLWD